MSKLIVITGGTSGIGLDTTNILRAKGHRVVVLSLDAEETEYSMRCDVSSDADVKRCFDLINERFGVIDVLVNNAGFGLNGVLELIPMDKIIKQYEVNVFGVIRCIQNALPYMIKGSRIINIGSAMVLLPMPYRSMYASSKSAVVTMSYSLRNELKYAGIDVTVVNPGNIRTNFTKNKVVVPDTKVRYGDKPIKAQQKFDNPKAEARRLDPKIVARKLAKLCLVRKTKPMYIVDAKMKLAYFVSKFVPLSFVQWIEGKVCN